MSDDKSIQLIRRLKSGDPAAEEEFVERYLHRLVALARKELSPKLQARFDPEDVVQSALGSFCVRVQDGRLAVEDNKVWNLLAKITVNKARGQAAHHTAQRRNVGAEDHYVSDDGMMSVRYSSIPTAPTASEVAICEEQIQLLLKQHDRVGQQIIELRMENYEVKEIAEKVSRSQYQVRYVLRQVRNTLESWAKKAAAT